MKNDKADVFVYLFTLGMGALASGLFAKAAYHKGVMDGYNDIAEQKQQLHKELKAIAEKQSEA